MGVIVFAVPWARHGSRLTRRGAEGTRSGAGGLRYLEHGNSVRSDVADAVYLVTKLVRARAAELDGTRPRPGQGSVSPSKTANGAPCRSAITAKRPMWVSVGGSSVRPPSCPAWRTAASWPRRIVPCSRSRAIASACHVLGDASAGDDMRSSVQAPRSGLPCGGSERLARYVRGLPTRSAEQGPGRRETAAGCFALARPRRQWRASGTP
jgi:hypothetical protein